MSASVVSPNMFRSYTWPSSGDVPCTMLLSALLLRHNFTRVCGCIFYLCCCHVYFSAVGLVVYTTRPTDEVKFSLEQATKAHREIEVQLYSFFNPGTRWGGSQWPRGLRRSPAEIMGSNTTGDMDICCECCVLSGRGLCDELITRPEES
jgi:hypothetical protein